MDKHQKRKELIEDVDLDRNDLEAALANASELWDKFGTKTTIVVLVAALSFMSWRLYSTWTQSSRESALTELAVETTPAGFRRIADDYADPAVKARALLAGGDTALAEAVRLDPTDDAETRGQTLDEAVVLYQRVLDLDAADVYRVNAHLGLAAVAESREQWDAARDRYAAAADTAGDSLAYLAGLARSRADRLDDFRRPVAFAPPGQGADVDTAPPGSSLPGLDLPAFDNPDGSPTAGDADDGTDDFDLGLDAMLNNAAGGFGAGDASDESATPPGDADAEADATTDQP